MVHINKNPFLNQGSVAPPTDGQGDKKTEGTQAASGTSGAATTGETSEGTQTQETEPQGSDSPGGGDSVETQSTPSHQAPANSVNFVAPEESGSETAPTPAQLVLQDWDSKESQYADPAVQKLQEFVRDLDQQNFKAMMDMMQKSLDNARKMMEQAQEHWVHEELPKKQALEKSLKQIDATKAALQEDASQQASQRNQVQQLESLAQHLQTQVQQNPNLFPKAMQANLVDVGQLARAMAKAIANQ